MKVLRFEYGAGALILSAGVRGSWYPRTQITGNMQALCRANLEILQTETSAELTGIHPDSRVLETV